MTPSPLVRWALLSCWLAGLTGCGGRAPAAADPERARDALRTCLDAWKNGATLDSLSQGSPSIIFRDEHWRSGWKLNGFRTSLEEPHGLQMRCHVRLELHSPEGKAAVKDVQYLVDTSPAFVIVPVGD